MTRHIYGSPAGIRFRSIIKGKNIMTPEILYYLTHKKQDVLIEVSEGTGFSGSGPIWGVTVITDGEQDFDRSKCVHSLEELEETIQELSK
jgi:hypothetical protein